jgi:hypothetical protein
MYMVYIVGSPSISGGYFSHSGLLGDHGEYISCFEGVALCPRDVLISLLSSRVYMTDRQIDQNWRDYDQLQRYTLPGIIFCSVVVRKASQLQTTTLPTRISI